ncbi:MAG: hypothetical protein M1415_04075 [Firmicutes bacterium]|jgi:hypothetical protein|nr:hypothetical protein [Bacillota bacterium]
MLLAKKIRLNVAPRRAKTLKFMQAKGRALDNRHVSQRRAGACWSLFDAKKTSPQNRLVDPEFNPLPEKLLPAVFFRRDEAMPGFVRGVKAAATPGFPRYDSRQKFFTLKDPGLYFLRFEGTRRIFSTGGRGPSKAFPDIRVRLPEAPPLRFREVATTKDAEGHDDAIRSLRSQWRKGAR